MEIMNGCPYFILNGMNVCILESVGIRERGLGERDE